MALDFSKKPFVVGAALLQNGQELRMRRGTVAPARAQGEPAAILGVHR
jgi:hypothetical protein